MGVGRRGRPVAAERESAAPAAAASPAAPAEPQQRTPRQAAIASGAERPGPAACDSGSASASMCLREPADLRASSAVYGTNPAPLRYGRRAASTAAKRRAISASQVGLPPTQHGREPREGRPGALDVGLEVGQSVCEYRSSSPVIFDFATSPSSSMAPLAICAGW